MDSFEQGGRDARQKVTAAAVLCGAILCAGCSCARVEEFLGHDTTTRPDVCVVVAPAGLPPRERNDALAAIVEQVADQHGRLTGYVAVGPSAAAFDRIEFGAQANRGEFASSAGNAAARDGEAQRWRTAAEKDLSDQLAGVAAAIAHDDGLDLVGGIDQCRRGLGHAARHPTVAVVTTGLHRTGDLDLSSTDSGVAALSAALVDAVRAPLHLDLYGIGRFDPAATGRPAARELTARVTAAWGGACAELADRCTSN